MTRIPARWLYPGDIIPTGLVLFEGRMGWFNLNEDSLLTPWKVQP